MKPGSMSNILPIQGSLSSSFKVTIFGRFDLESEHVNSRGFLSNIWISEIVFLRFPPRTGRSNRTVAFTAPFESENDSKAIQVPMKYNYTHYWAWTVERALILII